MNVLQFYHKKKNHEKISMITCYDYTSARIVAETSIECILIGDSVAMTMHGFKDTLSASLEMMCMHTEAVSRGAPNKFLIADMPFLSYRKSFTKNVTAAQKLMQSGAHALKMEGVSGNESLIRHFVESGIPIMGHLGLTPQFIHILGGYKAQGHTKEAAERLKADAIRLQEFGCFSIVLECVPAVLAKEISELLIIPTIGVGAGPHTDGQVLVFQDLLGLNIDFKPKFVKTFMNGHEQIKQSIEEYVSAIKQSEFPSDEHCY